MAQTVSRAVALDLLPAITGPKAQIFIKKTEDEELSWKAYINPFSNEMWLLIIVTAIILAFVLTFIEKIFYKNGSGFVMILDVLGNFWVALKANAGGKPSMVQKNTTYQIVLFNCLLG